MKSEITLTLEEYNELIKGRDKILNGCKYIISRYHGQYISDETILYYLDESEAIESLKIEIENMKIEHRVANNYNRKRKWWQYF